MSEIWGIGWHQRCQPSEAAPPQFAEPSGSLLMEMHSKGKGNFSIVQIQASKILI